MVAVANHFVEASKFLPLLSHTFRLASNVDQKQTAQNGGGKKAETTKKRKNDQKRNEHSQST